MNGRTKGYTSREQALNSLARDIEPYAKGQQSLPIDLQIEVDSLTQDEQDYIYDLVRQKYEEERRRIRFSKANASSLAATMAMIRKPSFIDRLRSAAKAVVQIMRGQGW